MNTMLRPTLLLGLGAALASPAAAQMPGTITLRTSVLEHPTGSYVYGQASQVVAGHFSDDAIPDAAVLMDGELHFLYAPDRRASWSTVGGGFTSIATRPGGFSGTMDDVLATGASGLRRLYWDGSPSVRTLAESSLAGTSSFTNATNLQVVAAASGTYEVVALHSTRKFIVRSTWNPSTGTLTGLGNLGVPLNTFTVAALQWDSDSDLEYAVASPDSLRVYDHGGALLLNIDETNVSANLAVVPMPGQQLQRVAWSRSPNGTDGVLSVVNSAGTDDSYMAFWGAYVHSMALMELDGSAGEELLLFSDFVPGALGIERGTSDTFLPWPANAAKYIDLDRASSFVNPFSQDCAPGTGVYGSNMTPPASVVADFDGDGDDDLLVAGHAGANESNRALVYFGKLQDEEAIYGDDTRTRAWLPSYSLFRDDDTIEFTFDCPVRPPLSTSPAGAATHLRITAWVQGELDSEMQRTAVANLVQDLDANPMPELTLSVSGINALGTGGFIHLEVSYLTFLGSAMTQAFPAYHEKLKLLDFWTEHFIYQREDNNLLYDGGSASGSTQRPPISPPSGGGGGTTTP